MGMAVKTDCWTWRRYPKRFCRDNFSRMLTVSRNAAFPCRNTFYLWRSNPLAQETFYTDARHGTFVLMYVHGNRGGEFGEFDFVPFYEAELRFFRGWIGLCAFHGEIGAAEWRVLDRLCHEAEEPFAEY